MYCHSPAADVVFTGAVATSFKESDEDRGDDSPCSFVTSHQAFSMSSSVASGLRIEKLRSQLAGFADACSAAQSQQWNVRHFWNWNHEQFDNRTRLHNRQLVHSHNLKYAHTKYCVCKIHTHSDLLVCALNVSLFPTFAVCSGILLKQRGQSGCLYVQFVSFE